MNVRANLVAITGIAKASEERTATPAQERALCLTGVFCDDADNTVDGIGAPKRRPRSADDFDAVDVLKHDILHVPKNAGGERRVDTAAINKHQ